MDTRLKNVSRRKSTKVLAFILTVIIITTGVLLIQYLAFTGREFESLFLEEYKDSSHFYHNHILPARNRVIYLIQNKEQVTTTPDDLNYYYYVSDGETVSTNAADENIEFFEQFGKGNNSPEIEDWTYGEYTDGNYLYHYEREGQFSLVLAFPDEYMAAEQEKWENTRESLMPFVIIIGTLLILALGLIIFLTFVTGRKQDDDELHMWRIDKIYTEILVIAFGTLFALWLAIGIDLFGYNMEVQLFNSNTGTTNQLGLSQIYSLILYGLVTVVMITLMGILFLSMVRKIKAKKFMKHSLIYTIYFKIKDFLKSFFDGRRFEKFPLTKALFYRQMAFIIVSGILVAMTFLFIFLPPFMIIPPLIEIAVIYWYVKYNNRTYEEINKGFDESLQEQMKSERMKVELITNVSHDLKTPLTSIISYIDLLSKEELSETARDYVNILSEKSYRLKSIVSDLFDLAKSTSGDINLDLEKLDLKKLIEQTLGDMADEIDTSGLQIRTRLPEGPVYIKSDGKRLYRVFQNLIDNALKYSLKGTRVYIELEEVNGKAITVIKNIAGYEMDFTAEEILQRFSRGDKSRTTEGSGLGLSIAESFTKVCGGEFVVDIDGDLFKVIIKFDIMK
ncbi:MAG: HAMP domain-containing histidine kinase [Tissierellia bacterium]|nr:HAMP domain-containing histidine kinase [Tissierellia bacterium]